ncbi:hypothetical protein S7711_08109 [Stachybotrys chartarum IBT 7711]|uniref:Diacylglycerol O-acyltransferase n=1 Tax=Stachybotrys chartarum (strain CBS 109288 / IBT 7711) TaxID=1280523 RepID=A0A084B264_STACB|nr:hypothetical protein S7711_08109 [Stachybotrys chartarum IBT 7711]KFA51791.1 hypothetical protein S40293_05877 [Stachybotrys chartarum IBT 40293]KFA79624.1 hypothetical protein S40288_04079 [Stachybotrys chartarum IBT 40288]
MADTKAYAGLQDVAHGKVTTIPYEEAAAATRAADQQGTEERPEGTQPDTDDDPSRDRESEAASVSSTTEYEAPTLNGEGKSYATAVTQSLPKETRKTESSSQYDDTPYPPLSAKSSAGDHERQAWKAAGIRFAPAQIPLPRRLQTAAVLFHCMSIVLFVSCFWFVCANPFAWPILVPYLIYLTLSTAGTNGNLSHRSEYLRSLPLWSLMAGYFPAKLHKTFDLPPDRKYIFGYHPHGIISHGAWLAFATNALGFREKFPGITNSLLTLDNNFRLPFHRDWILALGVRSVSKDSICNALGKGGPNNDGQGRAVTIVVGGARESLEGQPGTLRLLLKGRKGFIKMALRTGADLVPVLGFGENDLYDQLSPKTHPVVHKVQMFFLKVFKFTLPAFHARGLLNYDIGLMPYRRPLNIVVGRPIQVNRAADVQPTQEDIDRLHELYVNEVVKMWEAYKDQFAPDRIAEMQIMA